MSRIGRVKSLHVHPPEHGGSMLSLPQLEFVADQGIAEDRRYFGRRGRNGGVFKRQVTLIEREVIAEHAALLGIETLGPGVVRSNIETEGIQLVELMGKAVRIGTAELLFVEARTPCAKMDELCEGLRAQMEHNRQGVIARVTKSGTVRCGDPIVEIT